MASGNLPRPADWRVEGLFGEHAVTPDAPCCTDPLCVTARLVQVPDAQGAPQAAVAVSLYTNQAVTAAQSPGRNVVVGIDVSASLRTDDAEASIRGFLSAIVDALAPDDRLALVTFRISPELLVPMTEVGPSRAQLLDAIQGLEFGGATNLWGGLEGALFHAVQNFDARRENRVILLTDGRPTWGEGRPADIALQAESYVRDGILLSFVNLGDDQLDTITREVGTRADGLWSRLGDADDIEAAVAEQLDQSWRLIAREVDLTVAAPGPELSLAQGFSAMRWNGRSGELERPTVLQSAGGQMRSPGSGIGAGTVLMFEVPEPVEIGSLLQIGLRYRTADNRRVDTSVEVNVDAPPGDAVILPGPGWAHAALVYDVGRQMTAAMANVAEGRPSDGLDRLERIRDRLDDFLRTYPARDDVRRTRELVDDVAEILTTQGVRPSGALPVPEDPWPDPEPASSDG